MNLRKGFTKENVKDSTKQIKWQLENIERAIDHDTLEHVDEFIDFIETLTKHLKHITMEG